MEIRVEKDKVIIVTEERKEIAIDRDLLVSLLLHTNNDEVKKVWWKK